MTLHVPHVSFDLSRAVLAAHLAQSGHHGIPLTGSDEKTTKCG